MTEEEYFRKNFPDACYGDKPLSPYWDYFQFGVEFGERQSEKEIGELKEQIEKMKNWCNCGNYQDCLIQRAEEGKGLKAEECHNCDKWKFKEK